GWPAYPGRNGIRSSVCQKKLGCGWRKLASLPVCKAFCLARKRFWQKCGKNGSSGKGSKICKSVIAHTFEKAGKGLIKLTDMAVATIIKYAGKK
uniref:Parbolysin P1 n=1 Tax=Parborlasia corrugatus TaxID=187802 RepID=CXP1_PARCG